MERLNAIGGEKSIWLLAPLNPTSLVRVLIYHPDAVDLPDDRVSWRRLSWLIDEYPLHVGDLGARTRISYDR